MRRSGDGRASTGLLASGIMLLIRLATATLASTLNPLGVAAHAPLKSLLPIRALSAGRGLCVDDVLGVKFADFMSNGGDYVATELLLLASIFAL